MTRWWKGAAVVAVWLGLGVAGQAQQQIPSPVGAARMIEPLRYKPDPQPELAPGPLTPQIAPAGPPDCLSLPADHTSAFQCEHYACEQAWFGSAGGFGLRRWRPGSLPVAFNDSPTGSGPVPDTGIIPPGKLPVVLDLKDVTTPTNGGIRATVGYLECNQAVEVTGFYMPPSTSFAEVQNQGLFLVPFASGGTFDLAPFGFAGDNGLWKQADLVRVSYQTTVGSVEVNYRNWNAGINNAELIFGARYLYMQERLNVLTDDDFQTKDALGNSDPTLAATYSVRTRNNIFALQGGGEWSAPCPIPYFGWIWFTGLAKGGVGPNWVERDFRLSRGDGFQGFSVKRSSVQIGQVYELNACLDFHLLERMRIRFGYQALWAVGVSNPATQFNFNLSAQGLRGAEQNSAFWHGPMAELELLW
jgi:hypothetical protein